MKDLNTYVKGLKLKWNWANEGTPADLKGKASENLFEQMTTMLMNKGHLPWLSRIKKATDVEDVIGRFDFKLLANSESECGYSQFWIPIQIKSSFTGAKAFQATNRNTEIYLIVMGKSISLERLHQKLDSIYLNAVERKFQPAFH